MKTENIYSINYKIPEMPLEWYVCVNTCFPKAEYSANGCLSKEFGIVNWKIKNRINLPNSNLAKEMVEKPV